MEQISLWEFLYSFPGRASGVDTDEEMATAAARTTISGE